MNNTFVGKFPFYYGWIVVATAFVTMAVAVNARTSFSLLFPAMLDESGWNRSMTAGAFSVGFVASAIFTPVVGMMMDRWGPRVVIPIGAGMVISGLLGFIGCYGVLISMAGGASLFLLYVMVMFQGGLGFGLAATLAPGLVAGRVNMAKQQ